MTVPCQTADGACLQLEPPGPAAGRALPPTGLNHCIVPGTGGHGRARADALLAITGAFACRVAVFGYGATRCDTFLIIFAGQPVLDALDLLLPEAAAQMEAAGRAAASAYGNEVRAVLPGMRRAQRRQLFTVPYFRDYLRGWGTGAAQTVGGLRSQLIDAEGDGLAESLAVQQARAEQACSREFPDAALLRTRDPEPCSAFLAGREAGRTAGLENEYAVRHDLVFAML
jgi:hypothetical protein